MVLELPNRYEITVIWLTKLKTEENRPSLTRTRIYVVIGATLFFTHPADLPSSSIHKTSGVNCYNKLLKINLLYQKDIHSCARTIRSTVPGGQQREFSNNSQHKFCRDHIYQWWESPIGFFFLIGRCWNPADRERLWALSALCEHCHGRSSVSHSTGVNMATLLKNVTNSIWHAFNALTADPNGLVVTSKLKVNTQA